MIILNEILEFKLRGYEKKAVKHGVSHVGVDRWKLLRNDDEIHIEVTNLVKNQGYPVPTLVVKPSADKNSEYPASIILRTPIGDRELCTSGIAPSGRKTLLNCLDSAAKWIIYNKM